MCECKSYNRPDWGGSQESVIMVAPSGADVCIDPCLASTVQALWDAGIETCSSCCGHNGHAIAHMVLSDPSTVEQAHQIIQDTSPVPMQVIVWATPLQLVALSRTIRGE